MRQAFTIIELIFVIVLLGILAGAIKMNLPDNTLSNDIQFITQKIKESQLGALSYDNYDYANKAFYDSDTTCIAINKESFNTLESNSSSGKPYRLSNFTSISPNNITLCFDAMGRPYELNNFAKMPIEFNIIYKNRSKTVLVMPVSGNVIIK